MKYKILDIDKPTINNRVYTKDAVEKALSNPIIQEMLKNGGVPVVKLNEESQFINDNKLAFDMQDMVGVATGFTLDKDGLYADVKFVIEYIPKQVFAYGTGEVSYVNGADFVDSYNLLGLYIKDLTVEQLIKNCEDEI